ncbi:MAG: MBL fold metallo-hydrolase [Firmicutes bacterium]|nr:MBL fold metallo-hydrolase [Bacillota bacterium]
MGGIEGVLGALGKSVPVWAHGEDKPYIEGEREPIKMTRERVTQMLARAHEAMRPQVEALLLHPATAKVTQTLADGDVLPFFGGVDVIFTPGHTPGHISLYHRRSKTLITGDASVSKEGRLLGPSPRATPDMEMALRSYDKFAAYDVQIAICYHGGLCSDAVNEQLRAMATRPV